MFGYVVSPIDSYIQYAALTITSLGCFPGHFWAHSSARKARDACATWSRLGEHHVEAFVCDRYPGTHCLI